MRPAFSIICFTVLSGAGYGALFLLGLGIALGALPTQLELPHVWARFAAAGPLVADPRLALALALAAAALLATIGLLFSLGHLGKPLRAWRALSQWRSSWLSREGVASLATYMPLLALFVLLLAPRHTHPASMSVALRACGALLCAGATATVVCTAHIYASLQPVRAWHDRHVVPAYLLLGLQSGASWLVALAAIGIPARRWSVPLWLVNALLLAPCCAWIKRRYWHSIDAGAGTPGAGAATGLDRIGTVRSFEQPHTEENYLTHEMGFVLARRHSRRLRGFALSAILLAPAATLPLGWLAGWPAAWLAWAAGLLGLFVERWLFFAEAKHAVIAYYAR